MIIVILLIAFIIGLLRGGRPSNILHLRLHHSYLFLLSVLIDYGILFLMRNYGLESQKFVYWAVFSQYILLFICLWINRKAPFMWMTSTGVFLNYVVIMLNQGRMPLSQKAVEVAGSHSTLLLLQEGKYLTYTLIGPNTLYWYLGDVIYLPKPFYAFISIGDILLYAGIFLLIQQVVSKNKEENTRTAKSLQQDKSR